MHKSTVPVRRPLLVILIRVHARLHIPTTDKQRPAVESGAQARDDRAVDAVVAAFDGERPAVAAEDVGGGGAGVGAVVAGAGEGVVGDFAGDVAGGALGRDGEGVGCVVGPDLVDVAVKVGVESGRVDGDVIDGCDDAEGLSWCRGLAEVAPWLSVSASLVD